MQNFEIAVTLKGSTLQDIVAQAQALLEADGMPTPGKKAPATRRAAAPPVEEEQLELTGEEEPGETTEELDFMASEEEPPPAATKKAAPKKITDKDVNAQAIKYAKKHGRAKTFKLLKDKFKIESILELDEKQFPAVMKALTV